MARGSLTGRPSLAVPGGLAAARRLGAPALAVVLAAAGCRAEGPWDLVPVPALDAPAEFRLDGPAPPAEAAGGCPGRLGDPRDQTVLRLVRSTAGPGSARGDYVVTPVGRYGGDDGTLLRIDCLLRRALGLVPARP